MTLPETEVEPPNPFDCLNSVAEVCGFVWKRGGEKDLRQLLAMFEPSHRPAAQRAVQTARRPD